eukprot:jgi/Picsp_1/4474/NSC_06695-R1_low quality protein: uncharacterized glycosyltransferase ago61-like
MRAGFGHTALVKNCYIERRQRLRQLKRLHVQTAGGATKILEQDGWAVGENIFFHVNQFYKIIDHQDAENECLGHTSKMSRNSPLACIPVKSVETFLQTIHLKWVDEVSIWIDFPNAKEIENVGYWIEVASGLYGYLEEALNQTELLDAKRDGLAKQVKHIILSNLTKKILKYPWIMDILQLAVSPAGKYYKGNQPKLWFYWDFAKNPEMWVGFEQVVHIEIVDDSHKQWTKEYNLFSSAEKSRSFRRAAWEKANVTHEHPDQITLLISAEGGDIYNTAEILEVLRKSVDSIDGLNLKVRPYSPSLGVPFSSLMKIAARTKILVCRHGSLLGNSIFLPKDSTVIELLPYNYDGFGSFHLFSRITASLGDVTHLVWAANTSEYNMYLPEDARYASWYRGECYSDDCLEVHALSSLRVDINRFRDMVEDALVFSVKQNGQATLKRKYPDPERVDRIESDSGLWWD